MILVTEQEALKKFLKNVIDETENNKITTADEMITFIIQELQQSLNVAAGNSVLT